MKRPSFQFYPQDWSGNRNLRRCTHAERGVWMDVMCLLHDSEEYGILRWPLRDIAQAVGCTVAMLKQLVAKGVLKGDERRLADPFVYVPRSGRRDGAPVVLVEAQDGPIWYASRMVKDEYVRMIRGESTRFDEGEDGSDDAPKPAPKPTPKVAPKSSPKPAPKSAPEPPLGDGSSSSSSSSSSSALEPPSGSDAAASFPAPPARAYAPADAPASVRASAPAREDTAPPAGPLVVVGQAPGLDAELPRPVQMATLVRNIERARGKVVRLNSSDPKVHDWVRKGVTDDQLAEACALAAEDREANSNANPLNAGFIDVFVTKLLHPPPAKTSVGKGRGALPSERTELQRQQDNDAAFELVFGRKRGEVIDA